MVALVREADSPRQGYRAAVPLTGQVADALSWSGTAREEHRNGRRGEDHPAMAVVRSAPTERRPAVETFVETLAPT